MGTSRMRHADPLSRRRDLGVPVMAADASPAYACTVSVPPADLDVHFAEPHTTLEEALRYLRASREPPDGHDWNDAKVVGQSIGPRGVTFRFSFAPKYAPAASRTARAISGRPCPGNSRAPDSRT